MTTTRHKVAKENPDTRYLNYDNINNSIDSERFKVVDDLLSNDEQAMKTASKRALRPGGLVDKTSRLLAAADSFVTAAKIYEQEHPPLDHELSDLKVVGAKVQDAPFMRASIEGGEEATEEVLPQEYVQYTEIVTNEEERYNREKQQKGRNRIKTAAAVSRAVEQSRQIQRNPSIITLPLPSYKLAAAGLREITYNTEESKRHIFVKDANNDFKRSFIQKLDPSPAVNSANFISAATKRGWDEGTARDMAHSIFYTPEQAAEADEESRRV